MKNLIRSECNYENLSQKFLFAGNRRFDLQYSQIYAVRLMAMRGKLERAAREKWGDDIPIKKLSDIKENEECVIVGTLFRKMELQPSILKEISQKEGVLAIPPVEKCATDEDELVLEGEQQRILLVGEFPLQKAVTGTIVALNGHVIEGGKFFVNDFCYSSMPKYKPLKGISGSQDNDKFVLFVSGLSIGGKDENLMSVQLLIDLISGQLSLGESMGQKICRVIIAGNSLSKDTQDKDTEKVAKYLSRNIQAKTVEAVKFLDELLVQLGSCIAVDVLPGMHDPSNQFLPQQPLHKCMLPAAFSYSTVQSVTNPYKAQVDGFRLLGTSGQNISNIFQYSGINDRLEIMELTLNCGHISPTSPDTLACYPYHDKDPFVLDDCPNIYFAGNQPRYESKVIKGAEGQDLLLLCIPAFSTTKSAVMVNLKDLSCQPLTIDVDLISDSKMEE